MDKLDIKYKDLKRKSIKDFITHFELKDDKLYVTFRRNNEVLNVTVPYSKEDEEMLLWMMKYDANKIIEYKNELLNRIKERNGDITLTALLSLIATASVLINKDSIYFLAIVYAYCVSRFGISRLKNIQDKSIISDIDKYEYYLENEDAINNEDFLKILNISDSSKEINKITINDLDNYTLEDLETIVDYGRTDDYQLKRTI